MYNILFSKFGRLSRTFMKVEERKKSLTERFLRHNHKKLEKYISTGRILSFYSTRCRLRRHLPLRMKQLTSYLRCFVIFVVFSQSIATEELCDHKATCGCSSSSRISGKIVGGVSAKIEAWSWTVSISIENDYLCGGAILSDIWIITAAHCVQHFLPKSIKVFAGSNIRWSSSQIRHVKKVFVHPKYVSGTHKNDIALLHLNEPFDMLGMGLVPICLIFVHESIFFDEEWPPMNTEVV